MLDTAELRALAQWCRERGLRFLPLGTDAAGSVILFERLEPTRPWQRMKLVQDDGGFRLCSEDDDLLASGSDLTAILDALDGGVGEDCWVQFGLACGCLGRCRSRRFDRVVSGSFSAAVQGVAF